LELIFNIFVEISSYPREFFDLIDFMIVEISLVENVLNTKEGTC